MGNCLKTACIILSTLIVHVQCTIEPDDGPVVRIPVDDVYFEPVNDDLITYEFSFGADETATDPQYLLARPTFITAHINGGVVVADEGRLKIYDANGNGIAVLGRPGQGPAEFESSPLPLCGPDGYLLVRAGSSFGTTYNIFAPDYSFVRKERFRSSRLLNEYLNSLGLEDVRASVTFAYPKGASGIVYSIDIRSNYEEYIAIVYEDSENLTPLMYVKSPNAYRSPTLSFSSSRLGEVYWRLLPGNKIAYINTGEDEHHPETGSKYVLHIISIDGTGEKVVKRTFVPSIHSEEELRKREAEIQGMIPGGSNTQSAMLEEKINLFLERKYYPSTQFILSDGQYIFVVIFNKKEFKVVDGKLQGRADVFNGETGEFVGSHILPHLFRALHNGTGYRLAYNEEGFSEVRKYTLNPKIYGK